ncbi:hypothetical protein NPX13_g1118 [Xylaria arbuscula]|uniref:DUF6546 domain-containing protein n=1 Tax=Xylaria arbuscula TaxID=114810 RepID=A0A9W8NM16_9PEZI|nr:hypothetical protein NPX13_g1118 [Xylaria arbuscula]
MRTRSKTRQKPTWTHLPVEIRLMILEIIAHRKNPGWTRGAAVCKEWQNVLEKFSFHHDLALELNAYSPSDDTHFKGLYWSTDEVENDENNDSIPKRSLGLSRDGRRTMRGWCPVDLYRLFEPIGLAKEWQSPQVKAVTSPIIRRQLRRNLEPTSLAKLIRRFDRLENIVYEPWVPCGVSVIRGPHIIKQDLCYLLRRVLPNTLKKLTIFEENSDLCPLYPFLNCWVFAGAWRNNPSPVRGLEAHFASKSLHLEHLAVSFMVNAEGVFRHCESAWKWSHLQSIALTSQLLLDHPNQQAGIETLLQRAGSLAQQMPKLRIFVLWNGGIWHASAFIYRVDGDLASITWRGTWHYELGGRVVEAWQAVASQLPRGMFNRLRIIYERVEGDILSRGDAIYHLRLPCQVVEPASLWQMRREARLGMV